MKTNVLMLALAFFCSIFVYSNACSCMPQHPQEHFCNSDFVILARIKRERTIKDSKFFKVRVRKEFKLSEKGELALKSGRIISPKDDSLCGVNLEVGKLYLISGNIFTLKAYVNRCGLIMEWDEVTKRQRRGLRLLYKHGCSCKIRPCPLTRRCYRNIDSCNWRNSCETKEGICLRQANQSCIWTKTKVLASCTREWRRNVTSTNAPYRQNKSLFYH